MNAAEAIVGISVRMLPARLRDRYREEWAADVRGAEDAGVTPMHIALGAVAFAVSVDRPLPPSFQRPDATGVQRRGRLAFALALSSALLGLTQYPGVQFGGLTDNTLYNFAVLFFPNALLGGYAALAPIAALLIVTITRGVSARVRWAVALLSIAAAAPVVQQVIDSSSTGGAHYTAPGDLAYLVALVLIVAAAFLVGTGPRPTARARPWAVVGGAAVVALTASAAVVSCVAVWAGREMPVWNGVGFTVPSRHIDEVAARAQWAALNARFEALVVQTFVVAWIVVAVLVVLVIVAGLTRRRVAGAASIALFVIAFGYAGLATFLELGTRTASAVLDLDVLLVVARLALVAVVLASVGGVRLRYGASAPTQPAEVG